MSEDTKRAVHVKKFDGGKRTPAEVHRQLVFAGKTCSTCDQPAAVAAKMLGDDEEFRRRHPDAYMLLIAKFGGDPSFETKWGRMVTIEVIYACDRCKDGMRRFVAHRTQDWMHVDFDEGGLESSYPTQVGR
jgi:hypothetical protein